MFKLDWQDSIENLCTFAKVSYFCGCFFSFSVADIEFMYIVAPALKSSLTQKCKKLSILQLPEYIARVYSTWNI